MYYAQIDSNGIVYAMTQSSGIITQDNMIQIESLDDNLLGKKYENGAFVTVEEG